MKHTLRKKYIFFGTILIVGFLVFLMLTEKILQERIIRRWNMERMSEITGEVLEELESKNWDFAEADMDILAFENNVSITIADPDYKISFSTRSRETERGILGKKSRNTIKENQESLDKTGYAFYSDFDDDSSASFIYVKRLEKQGYLVLRTSLSGLKNSSLVMEICFILAAGMTLICGCLVLVWLTGKMVRPIGEMNRVTGQIARLNFDEKVQVNPGQKDELGELADSINIMSDHLKKAIDELKEDVENRKVLVRNMAHELKTPVAVIMGYAENMPSIAENCPEKLDKYCAVISNECERMDSLICQMLEVSAYEEGAKIITPSLLSADELLNEVRKCYNNEFSDHQGRYVEENHISDQIMGDKRILENALYNLVKNAVRYGRKDGLIRVRLWEDSHIHFSVYNEGSNIPEEEQDKIWDVFYKRDSARKRENRSFGIGLSIVKYAALAHGGGVAIHNMEDGVEIEFFIPQEKNMLCYKNMS